MAAHKQLFSMFSPKYILKYSALAKRLNSTTACRLIYDNYGDPAKVLRLENQTLEPPAENEVLIEMLAAPINPADINTIQGVYPVKPPFPSVPGNEGVGKILEVGGKVKGLKVGDWVVPRKLAWGTWRSHAIAKESEMQKITEGLEVAAAATMTVNPCTAYRMLKDYVDLEPGDVVIQNGGNSACGQCVIQLCREWGYTSVNVVRNRPDIDELKSKLSALGANYVVTEEELPSLSIFKEGVKKPKLALNSVGGKNCSNIMRFLDQGGVLVTYGGMSREPVTVPTSALIFKDISIRGYWMTRWSKENAGSSDHIVMLSEVSSLLKSKKLLPPAHELVPLADFQKVLTDAADISGKTGVKRLFVFN